MTSRSRSFTALLAGAFFVGIGAPVAAAAEAQALLVPAGAGQQALALQGGGGGLVGRVCSAAPCAAEGGEALTVPPEVRGRLGSARMRSVRLEGGKQLARIDVPGEIGAWTALVAAPLAGKGRAPLVLWSGWTDVQRGEHGEEQSQVVIEEPAEKGIRVIVGQRRADVTLCGRPTVVAARAVDPATMTLARGATVQNLSAEERARAVKLPAVRGDAPYAAPGFQALRPTAASSALGKRIAEIADGDPATSWAEAKAGIGRGEFIAFSAPSEVALKGLELRFRPSSAGGVGAPGVNAAGAGGAGAAGAGAAGVAGTSAAGGASPKSVTVSPDATAPRTLYVATTERLYAVSVPADAWSADGAGFEVTFPEEVQTSCVALVIEDAAVPRGVKNPEVTLSEVTARTAFDGMAPEALVGALAGGGERARAAAAVLARSGPASVRAAMEGYERLDQQGRLLAMGVVDGSSCAVHAEFFAERLASAAETEAAAKKQRRSERALMPEGPDPEAHHARDRIRRCGRGAAPALAKILARKPGLAVLSVVARELAVAAPDAAVPVLLDAMVDASAATRSELRAALSMAAQSSRARLAFELELSPEEGSEPGAPRPEGVRIDLLRSVGPALSRLKGSDAAFRQLAVKGASFRTRYLLLSPAAELARGGDAGATAWLRNALRSDADPHIRARAAEVAAQVPALASDLLAAVADPVVRVREAAVGSLGEVIGAGAQAPRGTEAALALRLGADPWTFVRSKAASALASLPPGGASVDRALAKAVSDLSPEVRGKALDALGARQALDHREVVRARAEEPEELTEVRARALLALGVMCDRSAVDLWTTLAQRARAPGGERDERLGQASIAALGYVHPPDLAKRLAPLLEKGVPRATQETARAALEGKGRCR
ncbi:HEAT repeat domain-containing protein [Chondromyces crocatus]|uniref:Vitellogenin domain-containing protein n=1 Tax=Chondromyces crocatus TaxID=52 RepID=A0A0K1EBD1_CHOCO|nr:HEAT repeat domain-containing protein [Chondromyces crocatus]AKT37992.1 uncharacterized protein CMC5_021330 [Chondromyces crocatus]